MYRSPEGRYACAALAGTTPSDAFDIQRVAEARRLAEAIKRSAALRCEIKRNPEGAGSNPDTGFDEVAEARGQCAEPAAKQVLEPCMCCGRH